MIDRGFVLIGDQTFFPGIIACCNALRCYGHKEPISVFDIGFTDAQRKTLQDHVDLRKLDADQYRFSGPKRAWESKAHALALPLQRLCCFIDADAFPTSNIDEMFQHAADGWITGGRDQDQKYDEGFAVYGIKSLPFKNERYFSTSCFSFDRDKWQPILDRWSKLCDENGGFGTVSPPTYPGHGDQGVLNAVVQAAGSAAEIRLLDNATWSCHWTFLELLPRFLNRQRMLMLNPLGRLQRVLHCGTFKKFWEKEHLQETQKKPKDAYVAFLKHLFDGAIQPTTETVPEHLLQDHHRLHDEIASLGNPTPHKSVHRQRKIIIDLQHGTGSSPGDVTVMTAAVRDLKRWYPEYEIDVRTSTPDVWLHNPHLTPLRVDQVPSIRAQYNAINRSNQDRDVHVLHAFIEDFNEKLGLQIKLTEFKPDIHLTAEEEELPQHHASVIPNLSDYWIVIAGGKNDFPAKHVDQDFWQTVVDSLPDKTFLQLGALDYDPLDKAKQHVHQPIIAENVVDLRGQTTIRECLRYVNRAKGVLCPVTFFMHAAAALDTPCIVVAGGREPPWWERYPGHDFLDTVGKLPCCLHGGCWRNECINRDAEGKQRCLKLIEPQTVVDLIKKHDVADPHKRMSGVMTAGTAVRKSTVFDTVAIRLDDQEIHDADGCIWLRAKDAHEATFFLSKMKFGECYIFGCKFKDYNAGEVHRLALSMGALSVAPRKIRFCTNDALPAVWHNFFNKFGLTSVEEGLKQTS